MSQLELPKGWINCQFKDIVWVNPKVVANDEDLSGFIPMSHAPVNFFDSFKYDERNWGEIKKKYTNFADGDVIFAKVTPCFENGKAALLKGLPNGIGAGSSEFYVLRPLCKAISSKYIFSIIKGADFLINGERNMTGAVGLRRVPRSFVEEFEISLPPVAEQQVIADKLEILLAQVESIKARLERIPEILKQFRQSVLAAAVSGKLTEEWRDANSKVFGEVKPLSFAGKVIAGQSPSRSEVNFEGKGEPYVTGPEQWDGRKLLHHKWTEHPKRIAPEGSIFVTVKGAGVGTTFPGSYAAIGRDIYAFVPNENMNYAYILFAIQASAKEVVLKAKGLIPGLTKSDIVDHEVYLPSIDEQAEIARLVEEFFAFADHIEKQVCAALSRVNNLTQSILAKAFRGELTAEWRKANPDLISGENSAEALLERIKAERTSVKPANKHVRGKA